MPLALIQEFEQQVEPEAISRIRWNNELGANKWLVKWKGQHDSEATWQFVYAMNQQYPSFHLGDKVSFEPDGIVRPPIIHAYRRRGKKENNQDDSIANDDK
ncbi:putative F-box/LRR-repeat protein 9 [Cucumis melo var. makuwa]|uniref:F-box/LRR-repeat protein 9 n=1 Tax=Cucumis melo var. makuwa TaxID=1194695 RepID=A0A5A7TY43_CUCMM|nr:putative F-box/LRR-repeat protein 9 [Cucumis melo var. makuwa]TYK03252.1 putative F-box/LRR-repeat protein 9 [Cucumis melo var. makuwa]